ncbi:MAG: TRAP transporter small permease [Roseibium sp.]|uniref:TRAP transporter small permease n=1 Tax=Roseibium sp. TaxID=1936156 RepID=UPI001B21FF74|nr:TRAP transporter small permease [Roseibium sp.]MBO6510122.1 TRAP transporter small permease [Roseibium sp.]MBO6895293.1 TRAP transporter small permease [Roseibium sp.]MBO6930779.1 TRAP transporter small permease [Roseibium sp.]
MSLSKIGTGFSNAFLYAAGGCFLLGTGVTVVDVALRAISGSNVPAAIELTSLSIGLGALLSIPVCYAHRAHVTAKLLSELSPARFERPLGMLGALVSVLFAVMLFWIVVENTWSKLTSPETTTDLGLPIPIALSTITITLGVAAVSAVAGALAAIRFRSGGDQ